MPESNSITSQKIRAWAGETIFKRGQDYQLRGRVRELAATPSGGVVAWVQGTSRYATSVGVDPGGLSSRCSCPYSGTCKHAVAVALAYVNRSSQAPLPVAAPNDPRLILLDRPAITPTVPAGITIPVPQQSGNSAVPQQSGDPALATFLSELSQPELVALLLEMAHRFPDLRDALAVRRMLATDDADELEAEVLGRIMDAGTEMGWDGDWGDEADLPDYDPVHDGLKQLLDKGHADAVVRLGEELLELGLNQIEHIHDEGETSAAIGSCLSVVFEALPRSSLAPHEQLLWVFDAMLRDPYDMCFDGQLVLEQPYPPESWSIVADDLLGRLAGKPATTTPDNFARDYARVRLADFAIIALEEAGRDEEIIPLCEREVAENGNYQRLVDRLLAAGRATEAEQWVRKGIVATERQAPGIARQLREVLRTLHTEAGDWKMVAALRAEDFFDQPTLQTLMLLQTAAEQAQVQPAVGAAVNHYLATGAMPQRNARVVGGSTIPAWPLPDTGLVRAERRFPLQFPQLGLLIELAANEGRPDDVLHWYDQRGTGRVFEINDDMVADAVAQTHPERATKIWQRLAEARIASTSPPAYQEAALFLRKLRQVWARQGKVAAWREYVAGLRTENRRKRRLVEILDTLLQEAV